MKVKNPPLSIDQNEPFKGDALNRKENVEALTQLISTFEEPMVISIESPWGTGKTTFIRMWRQHLINEGFLTLYFNAWENDFSDDALVSMIGEIGCALKDFQINGKQNKAKEFFDNTKKIGFEILKKSIPLVVKTATAGILDIKEDIEKPLSELTEQIAKDKIEDYEKTKKSIEDFKKQLSKFAKTISDKEKPEDRKPLIFFIDELDRCRPTYAIELLEKAKHLFNVEGIVFVLAVDKEQLGHSIKSVYGTGMEVDGYLRRFIDLTYLLPEPSKEEFCRYLFERFGIEFFLNSQKKDQGDTVETLINIFSKLFLLFKFSLRKQEQCLAQLSIVLRTMPSRNYIFPHLLGVLIVLRSIDSNLYKRFTNKECSPEEILDLIKARDGGRQFLNEDIGINVESYLMFSHTGYFNEDEVISSILDRYKEIANESNADVSQKNPEKERAENVLAKFNQILRGLGNGFKILNSLVKKIELTDRFEQ